MPTGLFICEIALQVSTAWQSGSSWESRPIWRWRRFSASWTPSTSRPCPSRRRSAPSSTRSGKTVKANIRHSRQM